MRKSLKTAVLILTAALLLCGVIGIGANAENDTIEVSTANVAYNDMMHLAFTLKNTNLLPEGAEAGVAIWYSEKDEYTAQNASYVTFETNTDGENYYYKSEGIAAPEIDNVIHVAACYKLGDEITITETVFDYSIVDYMVARLNEAITGTQAELYYNVLAYGLASDAVLEDDSYVLVKADGGYIGSYKLPYGIAKSAGESFLLRADAVNSSGEYFINWVDENGNVLSDNRIYTVTPETMGLKVYTAVYGDAADSAYAFAFNFDALTTGEIDIGTPDLSTAPELDCIGYSGTNMKRWELKYRGIPGLYIVTSALPVATVSGTNDTGNNIYEFTKDENGNYMVACSDIFNTVENSYGDKALEVVRAQTVSGYAVGFDNKGGDADCVEMDLTSKGISNGGVQFHISFEATDGTNKPVTFRSNLYGNGALDNFYIYAEGTVAGTRDENKMKDDDGNIVYISHKENETASIGIKPEIIDGVAYITYYVNGDYVGKIVANEFKAHTDALDYSKLKITYVSLSSVSACRDDIIIDSVCFK